ncbi:antitoxin family protein [Spirulina major]|uniref:antitoxin family protein n=1 Tax=Spirulina major TaxID=270636 RepID=UPI000932AB7B|nr:antitoxin family protein [Spirulina major]
MPQTVKAIYHQGTFILQTACDLPEGAEVEILIKTPQIIPPQITDQATKQHFLTQLVKRMQENSLPSHASKFTRDMLHERR